MTNGFAGFRPEALKFLRALKKNNDREWFHPRKDVFDAEVKAPMIELVAALQREIETLAPAYLQEPAKCVYRIYRDTRFSKDKTPYKTNISASIKQQGLGKEGSAVFYFQISPEETLLAAGSYMPGPEELRALRQHLAENHVQFQKLCRAPAVVASLGALQGAQLTRVPKGFDPEHPAADLLRRKQFFFSRDLDAAIVTTPALFAELSRALKASLPLMAFLNAPLAVLAKADGARFLREP